MSKQIKAKTQLSLIPSLIIEHAFLSVSPSWDNNLVPSPTMMLIAHAFHGELKSQQFL
ncbi:hypothetical protein [Thalassotalea ganghwensis]